MIMKSQTPQFILGYVFNSVEKEMMEKIKELKTDTQMTTKTRIPLSWFGCTDTLDKLDSKSLIRYFEISNMLSQGLDDILKDEFTNYVSKTFAYAESHCIVFTTTLTEIARSVTLEELEKLVGFKINLIQGDQ